MKLHLARNTKLLIAEDQVLAKSHMHYALEQLGFKNMNYVDRPSHALSALQEHDYDAIICSYNCTYRDMVRKVRVLMFQRLLIDETTLG